MPRKSVLERLWEVNTDAEIWWDSSPLIYDNWRKKMLAKAHDHDEMSAWLDRLYSSNRVPGDILFRGVTTNPSLSYDAIKDDPGSWNNWIDALIEKDHCLDAEVVFWQTYKEIVRRGAEIFHPIFKASGYKNGYISGQVDPRIRHDLDGCRDHGFWEFHDCECG